MDELVVGGQRHHVRQRGRTQQRWRAGTAPPIVRAQRCQPERFLAARQGAPAPADRTGGVVALIRPGVGVDGRQERRLRLAASTAGGRCASASRSRRWQITCAGVQPSAVTGLRQASSLNSPKRVSRRAELAVQRGRARRQAHGRRRGCLRLDRARTNRSPDRELPPGSQIWLGGTTWNDCHAERPGRRQVVDAGCRRPWRPAAEVRRDGRGSRRSTPAAAWRSGRSRSW